MRLLAPAPVERDRGVTLDRDQARVVAAALSGTELLVAGAPGTGKTTVLKQIAITALSEGINSELFRKGRAASIEQPLMEPVLYLAASRRSAAALRHQITSQIDRPMAAPVVRTPSAIAFAVLKELANIRGEAAPKLISGPEQDRILADLLAGHLAGEGVPVHLPEGLQPSVLGMRGFRHELRDLLMRARENGITPARLMEMGRSLNRPMWVFGAEIFAEYEANLALRVLGTEAGRQIDPAGLIADAAAALAAWPTLTDAPAPLFRMILVDDYQEATAATAQLLAVFQKSGSQLVIAGDADLTTQGFRGADPGLIARATAPKGSGLGAFGLQAQVLPTVWRHGSVALGIQLRGVVQKVTARIPTVGGPITRTARAAQLAAVEPERTGQLEPQGTGQLDGLPHRTAAAPRSLSQPDNGPAVDVVKLRGRAQEATWIANELRREHFLKGTPWEKMAVICRSGTQLGDLRRELLGAEVPVATLGADVPLHQEPAVAPVLTIFRAVTTDDPLSAESLIEILASPLGGTDAIGLRRLRQALLLRERSAGGTRTSDQLLVAALADERLRQPLGELGTGLHRVAGALAGGQAAKAQTGDIASVLWGIWAATGLAETWRQAALAGGNIGVRADRDLDAVMALFKAAEFFSERNPGAGAIRFAEYLASQDVPADSVANRAHRDAVAALTPTGAAGGEWDVVVVAGVQDGAWPDLRMRDSLFGTQAMLDAINGRLVENVESASNPGQSEVLARDFVAARAEVLADETRAFAVAVSRAKRRLIVTAVEGPDEVPSTFLEVIAGDIPLVEPGSPLDIRGIVGAARQALLDGGESATEAAQLLANLWASGVEEANPENWYGVPTISTTEPLWQPSGPPVPVSPSKVESVLKCPLRWAFESAGASQVAGLSQSVGSLIHAVAQALPAGMYPELRAELERRWPELDLDEGWVANRERAKAEAMLFRLAKYLETAAPAAAVEAEFRLSVENAVVTGRADRIEDLGSGTYRVVDLKTGSMMPSIADAQENPQLKTYQLALAEGAFGQLPPGAEVGGAHLLFVSSGQAGTLRKQGPIDSAGQMAARQQVITVAETMAAAEFAAKDNPNCRSCGLKFACPLQPESHRVGLG